MSNTKLISSEETEYEKRIRIAKKQGITVIPFGLESPREKSDKLLFRSDRLRLKCDIRNRDVNELNWEQRRQRIAVEKRIREHELDRLRKAIFRTFDNWEIKQGIETVEYEVTERKS